MSIFNNLKKWNANKRLILLIFLSFLLAGCFESHWSFGTIVKKVYPESKWNCFYEKEKDSFYVECFRKDGTGMDSFYTDSVRYME